MGFRGGRGGGRGGGSGRGGNQRGGGFRGGGSRGGSGRQFDQGPPEEVVEFGTFSHECEGQLVVYATIEKVPFFNAPVYLKNITQIGKIDEILGPITSYIVSVQLSDNYKASTFEKDQKLYIDPRKLLPLDRFLPKPPAPKDAKKKRKNADSSDRGGFKRFKDDRGGNRGRGGGNRSFGDKERSFGNKDRSFGNKDRSFGNNDRSFGNKERSFGSGGGFRGGSGRGAGRGGGSFRGRGGGRF